MKNLKLVLVAAFLVSTLALSVPAQAAPLTAEAALAAIFAAPVPQSGSFMPAATNKITCGPYCIAGISYQTPKASGTASNCTDAQSILTTQLQNIADNGCTTKGFDFGVCNFAITTTASCFVVSPGVYRVKGYANYSCKDTTC